MSSTGDVDDTENVDVNVYSAVFSNVNVYSILNIDREYYMIHDNCWRDLFEIYFFYHNKIRVHHSSMYQSHYYFASNSHSLGDRAIS
jgi:hypothetical protein